MKRLCICITCFCILLLLAGCAVTKSKTEKLKDLEFTVVEKDSVPEELKGMIEEKKKEPFKLTFSDKGYLYIAQGYGAKETSGYSIEVKECFESENAVYIHTGLKGPEKDEQVSDSITYPYVVVKLEYIDKNVVFE